MDWMWGGHMGLMAWLWIVVLVAIGAVVWFASAAGRGRGTGDASAEQQLKKRYAAGEIDRETYQRMLDDLRR